MTGDDVLPLLSPLRQASIIRLYVVNGYRVGVGQKHWDEDGTERYRSPAEIRAAVASDVAYFRENAKMLSGNPWHSCGKIVAAWTLRDRPRSSWRATAFTKLADGFGSQCWACGHNPACYLDHDHFTGEVRGLLCAHCNPWIDGCLHVSSSECFAAEYLNAPLRYPGVRYRPYNAVTKLDRRRCMVLGFNLFDRRCWPSPNPVEWSWTPPPPDSLAHIESCLLREFRAEWAAIGTHIVRTQGIRAADSA